MTETTAENQAPPTPRKRRWVRWGVIVLVLGLIGSELFARFYLGLGDPPLMMADPEIEYLYRPSQTCRRFGNRMHFNQWSMRSDDFPKERPADELRVLLVGDSIINGGTLIDDKDLATTILQQDLTKRLNRKVVVGNISAGSWGPENQLAYLKRYGLFGAQVVLFVWSEHDVADIPRFDPDMLKWNEFPAERPLCALTELFHRYLLPRMGIGTWPIAAAGQTIDGLSQPVAQCMNAMRDQILMAKRADAEVIVVRHYSVPDFQVNETAGHLAIRRLAEDERVPMISLNEVILKAIKERGEYYRKNDPNHPSAIGQHVMAEALAVPIEEALQRQLRRGS